MGMERLPIADAHMHVNPTRGLGAELVMKKFAAAGGWFASLIMLPTWDYGELASDWETYHKYLLTHLGECKKARNRGLTIACFAGLHPAEIDKLLNAGLQPDKVLNYGLQVLERLYNMCEEGKLDGIGELGRQHYKTTVPSILIAERLLEHALDLSKDTGCRLQLHLENIRNFTVWDIEEKLRKRGLYDKVIVHHARAGVAEQVIERGMWATTPAIRGNLQAVFRRVVNGGTLLIESDYIDDPKRPGVVSEPWGIGEVMDTLIEQGIISHETAYRLMVDNVIRFFGVTPP